MAKLRRERRPETPLSKYLDREPWGTSSWLAEQLGVADSVITRWRYGRIVPGAESRVALEVATGGAVKASAWGRFERARAKALRERRARLAGGS